MTDFGLGDGWRLQYPAAWNFLFFHQSIIHIHVLIFSSPVTQSSQIFLTTDSTQLSSVTMPQYHSHGITHTNQSPDGALIHLF